MTEPKHTIGDYYLTVDTQKLSITLRLENHITRERFIRKFTISQMSSVFIFPLKFFTREIVKSIEEAASGYNHKRRKIWVDRENCLNVEVEFAIEGEKNLEVVKIQMLRDEESETTEIFERLQHLEAEFVRVNRKLKSIESSQKLSNQPVPPQTANGQTLNIRKVKKSKASQRSRSESKDDSFNGSSEDQSSSRGYIAKKATRSKVDAKKRKKQSDNKETINKFSKVHPQKKNVVQEKGHQKIQNKFPSFDAVVSLRKDVLDIYIKPFNSNKTFHGHLDNSEILENLPKKTHIENSQQLFDSIKKNFEAGYKNALKFSAAEMKLEILIEVGGEQMFVIIEAEEKRSSLKIQEGSFDAINLSSNALSEELSNQPQDEESDDDLVSKSAGAISTKSVRRKSRSKHFMPSIQINNFKIFQTSAMLKRTKVSAIVPQSKISSDQVFKFEVRLLTITDMVGLGVCDEELLDTQLPLSSRSFAGYLPVSGESVSNGERTEEKVKWKMRNLDTLLVIVDTKANVMEFRRNGSAEDKVQVKIPESLASQYGKIHPVIILKNAMDKVEYMPR